MEKEKYGSPSIHTEAIEIGVYGFYCPPGTIPDPAGSDQCVPDLN